MNKRDLVLKVAGDVGLSQDSVSRVISSLIDSINDGLSQGEEVKLIGLGTFSGKLRAGHIVKHPTTKVSYNVPDKFIPRFIPSSVMRKSVEK